MSRILKFTSPDDAGNVHLYEMREEFEDHSRPVFFTERVAETPEGYGVGPSAFTENPPRSHEDGLPSSNGVVNADDDGPESSLEAGCPPRFSHPPSPDEALLGTAIQELIREQRHVRERISDRVHELAVVMAKKIIRGVHDRQPEMALDQVRVALKKAGSSPLLTIRVHPTDAEYLTARKETILNAFEHIERVIILGDPAMTPGGCVIETDRELIDATIESQLELLDAGIKEREKAGG